MIRKTLAAGCAVLTLAGCNAARQQASPLPPIGPTQTITEPEQAAANPGSMFNDAEADLLFSDSRARRVGDIVLIKVVENAKGKNKADTTAERDSTNNYGVGAFFGQDNASINPFNPTGGLGGRTGTSALFQTNSNSKLDGKGETKRENTVTATIAARVVRSLPGGLLQVEGARETRINEETQYIVVSGLVRTRDVASDNSVLSSQMADSRIAYYGKGVLADKQRSGWFTRLMDNFWPF